MNIMHVTPYYAPAWAWGGVVAAVTGLAQAQQRAGHRVFVLTTDTLGPWLRGAAGSECLDGVHVTRVATRSLLSRARWNLSWPRNFLGTAQELIEREAVDIVHCHELRTVETSAASRAAARAHVPAILSAHGTLSRKTGRSTLKRGWDLLFARRVFRRFRCVVALAPAEREDIQALCSRSGVAMDEGAIPVVPNGVDACPPITPIERRMARERLGLDPHEHVVLFLGRLHERKRIPLILEAFAVFVDRCPPARLILAGPDDGALATIHACLETLALTSRVLLPGLVVGGARRDVLAAADVFTLAGAGEGLPMAALEALAAGLPAVLGPGCHLPEVAAAGAGFVVEAKPDAFAAAWERVVTRPDGEPDMGHRARDLVSTTFSWPAVAARLEEVYRQAVDSCRDSHV